MYDEDVYVLCRSRYGGAYEGGEWLAFPCHQWNMGAFDDAFGDDVTCREFFESPEAECVGRGDYEEEALHDMRVRNPMHGPETKPRPYDPEEMALFNRALKETYGEGIREWINSPSPFSSRG